MPNSSSNNKSLFHYTNEAGLFGILETQCIWATHYKFLNDSTELVFYKDHLIARMVRDLGECQAKALNNDEDFNEIAEQCWIAINSLFAQDDCYVASFCKASDPYVQENGLLSQWRSYGQDSGYAIEFELESLRSGLISQVDKMPFKNNCLSFFDDCVYRDYIDHNVFSDFSVYLKKLSGQIHSGESEPSPDLVKKALFSVMRCAVTFKHHAFSEENEVRIAIHIPSKSRSNFKQKIKFRDTGAPYVELFNDIKSNLPIKGIIVGPHKEKYIRADKLKHVLMVKGLENINVSISDIPFR